MSDLKHRLPGKVFINAPANTPHATDIGTLCQITLFVIIEFVCLIFFVSPARMQAPECLPDLMLSHSLDDILAFVFVVVYVLICFSQKLRQTI